MSLQATVEKRSSSKLKLILGYKMFERVSEAHPVSDC